MMFRADRFNGSNVISVAGVARSGAFGVELRRIAGDLRCCGSVAQKGGVRCTQRAG